MRFPDEDDDERDPFKEVERHHTVDYGSTRPRHRVARSVFVLLGGLGMMLVAVSVAVLFLGGAAPLGASLAQQVSFFFQALIGRIDGASLAAVLSGWAGLVTLVVSLVGLYTTPPDRNW